SLIAELPKEGPLMAGDGPPQGGHCLAHGTDHRHIYYRLGSWRLARTRTIEHNTDSDKTHPGHPYGPGHRIRQGRRRHRTPRYRYRWRHGEFMQRSKVHHYLEYRWSFKRTA